MLEHLALWLSAPLAGRPPGPAGGAVRLVLDAASRTPLGQIVTRPWRWWPWRVRAALSAYEGPDASALFTARRAGWLPHGWDVIDADGHPVALIRGPYLLAPGGGVLGVVSDRPGGVCVGPGGRELAAWRPGGAGLR